MHSTHFPLYPTVSLVGGIARIYVGKEKLHETAEPAFLLDHHTGTVLRYGDRVAVEAICSGMQQSYQNYEMDPSELEVVVFPAATTTADLLKSFFEHPHALSAWVQEYRVRAA